MSLTFRESSTVKRGGTFEAGLLSDDEKERLCRDLLAEFDANVESTNSRGELIHKCSLPWHDERNASASLNYKKLTYNCFSCGSSGGLLWYIATCRGETSESAAQWLADQTGTGPDEQPLSALLDYFESVYGPRDNHRAPIPKMSPKVLEPWLKIHPYMTEMRGIPVETLMHFKVGYGVMRCQVSDNNWTDSHRIVIPHWWHGDLVGWQTRRLMNDGTPKYLSTPDFPKDQTIYNFDQTADEVVAVESPMSVQSKFHMPWHIEGTFGAKVTERQMRLLSIHRRIILFFDNDKAGWQATEAAIEELTSYSDVFVVDSPWAADPADFDDNTYASLVANAVPASLWCRPKELQPWESNSTSPSMTLT